VFGTLPNLPHISHVSVANFSPKLILGLKNEGSLTNN